MNSQTYSEGFQARMDGQSSDANPHDNEGAIDWLDGWYDADEAIANFHVRFTLRPVPTDDGKIDMFIIGEDGIPVARIKKPTTSGEEAVTLAIKWIKEQEAAEKAGMDDQA